MHGDAVERRQRERNLTSCHGGTNGLSRWNLLVPPLAEIESSGDVPDVVARLGHFGGPETWRFHTSFISTPSSAGGGNLLNIGAFRR
jgi:hypothetical protein